jgi:hypothetical protein
MSRQTNNLIKRLFKGNSITDIRVNLVKRMFNDFFEQKSSYINIFTNCARRGTMRKSKKAMLITLKFKVLVCSFMKSGM